MISWLPHEIITRHTRPRTRGHRTAPLTVHSRYENLCQFCAFLCSTDLLCPQWLIREFGECWLLWQSQKQYHSLLLECPTPRPLFIHIGIVNAPPLHFLNY